MRPIRDKEPIIQLGVRLKELRKKNELTQQAVAEQLQVDRSTYAKYEIGRVCPDQQGLLALAELFGVTVDYLLGREGTTPSPVLADGGEIAPLELTPDEMLLIQTFRTLSPEEREQLIREIREYRTARRDTK